MSIWIFTTDGVGRKYESETISLEDAQAIVGGYVEIVYPSPKSQMVVNEEGLLIGLNINEHATEICGQTIMGNAILLTGESVWG